MILRPEMQDRELPSALCLPAWVAVNQRQHAKADSYWLIAQPDHARLSGELAAHFANPKLDDAVVRGIGAHDSGWSIFEAETSPGAEPLITPDGKPRSFTEMPPQDFVRAWETSIACAEQIGPIAGLMVSRHFRNLGEFALVRGQNEENSLLIREFLDRELEREARLKLLVSRSPEEIDGDVKALQFCDLLSLYLCCGAGEQVELPFDFGIGHVRVRRENGRYDFSPSPFAAEVHLCVAARRWPSGPSRQIEFLLR
jgi:hypothetical protein